MKHKFNFIFYNYKMFEHVNKSNSDIYVKEFRYEKLEYTLKSA